MANSLKDNHVDFVNELQNCITRGRFNLPTKDVAAILEQVAMELNRSYSQAVTSLGPETIPGIERDYAEKSALGAGTMQGFQR